MSVLNFISSLYFTEFRNAHQQLSTVCKAYAKTWKLNSFIDYACDCNESKSLACVTASTVKFAYNLFRMGNLVQWTVTFSFPHGKLYARLRIVPFAENMYTHWNYTRFTLRKFTSKKPLSVSHFICCSSVYIYVFLSNSFGWVNL